MTLEVSQPLRPSWRKRDSPGWIGYRASAFLEHDLPEDRCRLIRTMPSRPLIADKFRPNVQRTAQILPEELWRNAAQILLIHVSMYSARLVGSGISTPSARKPSI